MAVRYRAEDPAANSTIDCCATCPTGQPCCLSWTVAGPPALFEPRLADVDRRRE
jgi:hypothetical protein